MRKTWIVVEQPRFAAYGREHFQSDELKFCDSLPAALQFGPPDVALLSSVLQYLPEPWTALDEISALGCRDIVIDRTVVNMRTEDKLYVQHVAPSIYPADYPCWSLSEAMLATRLKGRYDLVCDFPSLAFPALRRIDSQFKGYLFRKRSGA
jgi:putative methyltransferase (TIGR04325 family)